MISNTKRCGAGLDASTALEIIRSVKRLTAIGMTVPAVGFKKIVV